MFTSNGRAHLTEVPQSLCPAAGGGPLAQGGGGEEGPRVGGAADAAAAPACQGPAHRRRRAAGATPHARAAQRKPLALYLSPSSSSHYSPPSSPARSLEQDTKVDAPMAEVWLASLMGELMHAKVLSPTLLQTPPDQMVEDGIAASFAVAVLAHVKVRHPAPCPISREFRLHALRGSEHACSFGLMCTLMLIYTGEPRRRACQGAEGGGRP